MGVQKKYFKTEEEVNKVIETYLSGSTMSAIAEKNRVYVQVVRDLLLKHGVSLRDYSVGRPKKLPVSQRKCNICKIIKRMNEFRIRKDYPSGKDYRCRDCDNILRNDRRMKRTYGLSQNQYDEMFLKQNGKCEICKKEEETIDPRNGKPRKLSVDHCHEKNIVRGLLCQKCNVSLGNMNDDCELLQRAIDYLKKCS